MKVLLNKDVDNLGLMGDVVEVADGYARNYLIPRGIAEGITRGRLKDIEERKRILDIKAARRKEKIEQVADRLKSKPIVIKARCSASGKLFGSVTNRQLAQEINSLFDEEIDRHKILLDDRVRSVGVHQVRIKLHPEVEVELEFEVEGEGFEPVEPEEESEHKPPEGAEQEPPEKPEEETPEEAVTEAGSEVTTVQEQPTFQETDTLDEGGEAPPAEDQPRT